jgi:hypothetical protein
MGAGDQRTSMQKPRLREPFEPHAERPAGNGQTGTELLCKPLMARSEHEGEPHE